MTDPHAPTLAQVRTHWRRHDWAALSQIDVDAITSAEHRAKLALCAAVGLGRQGQASAAMQALERALDWGIAPEDHRLSRLPRGAERAATALGDPPSSQRAAAS
jgi:hypothetical protein